MQSSWVLVAAYDQVNQAAMIQSFSPEERWSTLSTSVSSRSKRNAGPSVILHHLLYRDLTFYVHVNITDAWAPRPEP
jgi:hypothetical protein